LWEPVKIDGWRGRDDVDSTSHLVSYDEEFYLIKEEVLPDGERKLILKDRKSGNIIQRVS
jgi:hypothetical protein